MAMSRAKFAYINHGHLMARIIWGNMVKFCCDNVPVICAIHQLTSCSEEVMRFVQKVAVAVLDKIFFLACNILSVSNDISDVLRLDFRIGLCTLARDI